MLQQFTPTADSWNIKDPDGFAYLVIGWSSSASPDGKSLWVDPVLATENGFETLTEVRKRWGGRGFTMERV